MGVLSTLMKLIRVFLWTLVGAMCIQGYLRADEYGSEMGVSESVGHALSVWGESLGAGSRWLVGAQPRFVGLPRAVVEAALQETARHPATLAQVPRLQARLREYSDALRGLHDAHLTWALSHTDLVLAMKAEESARQLWEGAMSRAATASAAAEKAVANRCRVTLPWDHSACQSLDSQAISATLAAAAANRTAIAWSRLLAQEPLEGGVIGWWMDAGGGSGTEQIQRFLDGLSELYNVTGVGDERIVARLEEATVVAVAESNIWLRRILTSLLEGEVWDACIRYVTAHESRTRDIMVAMGVDTLFATHDRVRNASLRAVKEEADAATVRTWFDEMAAYAWWLGDDIPGHVRRCVRQTHGVCTRIGPTEIAAMSDRVGRREQIVRDVVRRLTLGLWSALPGVGLVILFEFVLLCVQIRGGVSSEPREVVLRVEGRPLLQAPAEPVNQEGMKLIRN